METMHIEDKLARIGLSLPAAAKPAFAYVPVTLHDGVAYVSGQLPKIDGEVKVFGKVGREVTLDVARKEARVCALQALEQDDFGQNRFGFPNRAYSDSPC